MSSTPIRKKKRLLTASKKQNEPIKPKTETNETQEQPKKKKKRQLNRPNSKSKQININTNNDTMGDSETVENPVIETPQRISPLPVTAKRSIRASSEAIARREKTKMANKSRSPTPIEEEKPVIRKKRKLNTQKIIMPSSSLSANILFEETGNISYSEYLETSSSTIPRHQKKPNIVIGVPSKRNRKIKKEVATTSTPVATEPKPVKNTPKIHDTLDLSQHSILPNSSYIAHLPPNPHKRKSITPINTSEDEEQEVLFTMMNNDVSDSSLGEFYDALSDFDDEKSMQFEDSQPSTQPENMQPEDIQATTQSNMQPENVQPEDIQAATQPEDINILEEEGSPMQEMETTKNIKNSFWDSLFKSFSKK